MKIKLDENLGSSLKLLFNQYGHDVQTVGEENLKGADDHWIIEICKTEKRCLVTLDMDFSNPLIFNPKLYFGIVVIRIPSPLKWDNVTNACQTLIKGIAQRDIKGKLWIIQGDRIREYSQDTNH